jgi:hypothetical protein
VREPVLVGCGDGIGGHLRIMPAGTVGSADDSPRTHG